eukprot:scaffold1236_cov116-Isochrysis_galbana.AAC.6
MCPCSQGRGSTHATAAEQHPYASTLTAEARRSRAQSPSGGRQRHPRPQRIHPTTQTTNATTTLTSRGPASATRGIPERRARGGGFVAVATRTHERLVAVAARRTATTRLLELAALGAHKGLDVRVAHTRGAEVPCRLAARLAAPQQYRALSRGGLERELVKRQALPTRLDDARARGGGEAQGADGQLRHLKQAGLVGDRANTHRNLVLRAGWGRGRG